MVLFRYLRDCGVPMCAAKEAVWDNSDYDVEMAYTAFYPFFRATGKINEAKLVVHHKIDRYCCQDAYLEYLQATRSAAYTTNKHISRGLVNEKVNGAGKAFMRGKPITAHAIQEFYGSYDAVSHIQRTFDVFTSKHKADNAPHSDYLHKYEKDKEILLSFFMERLGSTWTEATKPSRINRMTGKSSGNEPWKHVDAIGLGKRHIGERKNRMSSVEHIRKHTARHSTQ